ncbi:MAG: hypothetical protein OES79_05395 [Planctomycetota bacterium]|nr:hypothetical protein [Planctomycetota bacterium]
MTSTLAPALIIAAALTIATALQAAPPDPPAASTYAPIADLATQVDYYVGSLEKALDASGDEYSEAKQKTVRKQADTLAALSLVIGNHDQQHALKASAGELLAAAGRLAGAAGDQQAALKELESVKQAAAGGEAAGGSGDSVSLQWRKVADMENLMKQTQFLNSRLKRSVKGSKLKSQADKTTAYTATLAAIAQATMADTSDVENPADLDKWYQFCADMRDAAGAVNQAIHQQNEVDVQAAMKKLKASCDACHAVFEEDEL